MEKHWNHLANSEKPEELGKYFWVNYFCVWIDGIVLILYVPLCV